MDTNSKSNIYKNFGTIFKNFRIANNLTQEQLSEKLDISLKYISRIENGNSGVKTQTLINYINLLGITPNILYNDFITNENILIDLEISQKISSLSNTKKQFISSIIDSINDI